MAAWQVQIREKDRPTKFVVAWLGDGAPTPAGGGGGWDTIELPRTHAVQVWKGSGPLVQTIPVVFGATSSGVPVGSALAVLGGMWRPEDDGPPPVVRVIAEGNTILYQNLDYVITGLDYGEAVADASQQRVQQQVTLELTEYKPDERLVPASKRKTDSSKVRARMPRTYRVKPGDTATKIAKQAKVSWRDIAALNRISDPRDLKPGMVLRLPRP